MISAQNTENFVEVLQEHYGSDLQSPILKIIKMCSSLLSIFVFCNIKK